MTGLELLQGIIAGELPRPRSRSWWATTSSRPRRATSCSTLPEGAAYVALEVKFNLVRPITAETGPVRAEGRVVHRGRTVAISEADLRDGEDKLLAHATSTCLMS